MPTKSALSKQKLERQLAQVTAEHGEWCYDIPLPHGVWTGEEGEHQPHTRLKRVVQIAYDLARKPLSACRVLDLGCLEGLFALEFALHGASVVGVEAREMNIRKANFAKEALGLSNLEFVQDDVRSVTREKYGSFDVVLASGILYHLNSPDVFSFVETNYELVEALFIIDTHISLRPRETVTYRGRTYHGRHWQEHAPTKSEADKAKDALASYGNDESFQLSRPSLLNLLGHVGFSSVYECFNPPHLNFGMPGLEHENRCTFVAIKNNQLKLHTSPAANSLVEDWPEGSLTYAAKEPAAVTLKQRLLSKLRG